VTGWRASPPSASVIPPSEGLSATVAALQRGQADALVVNYPAEEWPPLCIGTAPDQIALSAADLHTLGATGHGSSPRTPPCCTPPLPPVLD
jgi:hypothetical protein